MAKVKKLKTNQTKQKPQMMTHVQRESLFIDERSTVWFTPMKISVIVLQKPKIDTSYN